MQREPSQYDDCFVDIWIHAPPNEPPFMHWAHRENTNNKKFMKKAKCYHNNLNGLLRWSSYDYYALNAVYTHTHTHRLPIHSPGGAHTLISWKLYFYDRPAPDSNTLNDGFHSTELVAFVCLFKFSALKSNNSVAAATTSTIRNNQPSPRVVDWMRGCFHYELHKLLQN